MQNVNKKKLLLLGGGLLVVIGLAVFACVRYFSMHGTCGNNVTWAYDGQGTLTISGMGKWTTLASLREGGCNLKMKYRGRRTEYKRQCVFLYA